MVVQVCLLSNILKGTEVDPPRLLLLLCELPTLLSLGCLLFLAFGE